MARQQYKTVHTSLRTSRKVAAAEHRDARLYFHVLLTSDAYGTLSGDPWDVLHEAVSGVRGFDLDTVAEGLDTLVGDGLLERWTEPDGSTWLYVVKHDAILSASQRGKRGERSLPTPPSQVGGSRRNSEAAPTSRHDAKSEAVGGSRPVSRGEEILSLGDGLTEADLAEILRQRRELDAEEAFLPAHERLGSARAAGEAVPAGESSEPLHVTRGSGGEASDHRGSGSAATSADALTAPAASPPTVGATIGSQRRTTFDPLAAARKEAS